MELSTITAVQKLTSPNPFCLIGTEGEHGKTNLAAASWWNYASNRPPMLTVCLSNRGFSGERIRKTGRFVLQLLPGGFEEAAFRCGTISGRNCDKAENFGISLESNVGGYPDYVKGSAVVLNCLLKEQMEASDHTVYLALAESVYMDAAFATNTGKGILYAFEGYKRLDIVKERENARR
ncbi:MAG: flavin reductase family protein [Lachnospiraceae bacterium]|nr:flavin reductase family protein [Lachnospiraceae bacterium]